MVYVDFFFRGTSFNDTMEHFSNMCGTSRAEMLVLDRAVRYEFFVG